MRLRAKKNKKNYFCGNIIPKIEILNISSDSRSETEREEPILAYNKKFLPKITDMRTRREITSAVHFGRIIVQHFDSIKW